MNSKNIRRLLQLAILLVVLVTAGILLFRNLPESDKKPDRSRPSFSFNSLGNEKIKSSDYDGKKLVISYFNPACGHCQALAKDIVQRKAAFQGVSFLFISKAELTDIESFIADQALLSLPSAKFARVQREEFYNFFGEEYVPLVLAYDEKGNFRGRCMEDCTALDLIRMLSL